MKKIFLISCYIIAVVAMASCTNDDVETNPHAENQQISADDPGDGQSGQIPTKPPRP
ncbi:hypothetical protein [Flavobacterium aquicola]|uniref:Uncharacterized protein n=1 Tax=Flavobacterium aquicola TaxID=1682742 RepID=A0A3E0DWQ5_9FLAO|nr:hypothetical protein [Flavobacterium aquicola]REG90494.1 hypothetical protein C8P67_12021 [Flavobacterium aquicola]